MGYYTSHTLTLECDEYINEREVFDDLIDNFNCYGIDYDGRPSDDCKWYNHEDNMKDASKKYPNIVFKLQGQGEEAGDIWCKYFYNGLVARHTMPEWTPPEFDYVNLTK